MLARVATLTALPESFAAGTTVKYTRTLPDYPANGGWTLTLYIAGAAVLTQASVASGADHSITLTGAQTATLTPAGMYRWQERVSDGTNIYEVGAGSVYVSANLATAGAGTLRTIEEKLLAAIDAVIEGKITDDVLQYSIHGRGLTLMPRLELYELRKKVAWDVARQRGRGKAGRTRRIAFTGTENES